MPPVRSRLIRSAPFPLLLLAYAALVLMLDGASTSERRFRDAALTGWAFGFGFFLVGHYWVGYAFLVDAEAHAWLMPFAVVLLAAGLALFFAAASALCMVAWRPGAQRVFLFAVAFTIAEWLRGHIFTGFPWNLPGYGWGASTAILQSASVFGVYGLSLLTLLFGASLALLAGRGKLVPAAFALLFVTLWAAGELRLAGATNATVPDVRVRIVQPATPQPEKYAPENRERNWRRLIELSSQPAAQQPTHIVWPEAAPPFLLEGNPDALADIAALTGDYARADDRPGPRGRRRRQAQLLQLVRDLRCRREVARHLRQVPSCPVRRICSGRARAARARHHRDRREHGVFLRARTTHDGWFPVRRR